MLEIGTLVDGKYKILNKIGQGGMSVVYLAMNEKANKQWAIKEVRKDGIKDFEVVKQGLVVETDMLKRLNHPNLPSIVDVIEDRDTFLIVMDYIEGNPLSRALEEYGAQTQENVIAWAKQLCDVLGYLHSRTPAIIYRDMKPANIMLKPDGSIALIDFGTAREFKEKKLADTTCLGTVGYAAPEQFGNMGQTDGRTDIYGLGATLYHLITGKSPCEPPYVIRPIREINPTLSAGLEQIILRCTQRNPDDRYQSTAELMYALEHYDEIDEAHIRKQKRKLACFLLSTSMTVICGAVSLWGYASAENKKNNNYDEILKNASTYEDYYEAILTNPSRTEAYSQLNAYLTEDFELSKEEGSQLLKLQAGLVKENVNGYSETVDVLSILMETNRGGYEEICYEIGESFLFYYDVNLDRDRYSNAAKWFQESVDTYEVAAIYCDIAGCLELINQYNSSKIKQTDKMYEQYEALWETIETLCRRVDDFESVDSKLQVWEKINDMIYSNVSQFLEVTDEETLLQLLNGIKTAAEQINKSVLVNEITQLQQELDETVQKVESGAKQREREAQDVGGV